MAEGYFTEFSETISHYRHSSGRFCAQSASPRRAFLWRQSVSISHREISPVLNLAVDQIRQPVQNGKTPVDIPFDHAER